MDDPERTFVPFAHLYEIALSRIHRRVHRLSQSTGLFAHLAHFNTRCEIGVVCGTSYIFD